MLQPAPADRYAGFVSRALALVIDLVALSVILLLVAVPIQAIVGFFSLYGAFSEPSTTGRAVRVAITVVTVLVTIGLGLAYPIAFWMLVGQTPGKALMGLRVVRIDGRQLTFGCALRRCLGYGVSTAALCLGFAWVLVDERRQAWHDKFAGTCVIYAWGVRPAHPTMDAAAPDQRARGELAGR